MLSIEKITLFMSFTLKINKTFHSAKYLFQNQNICYLTCCISMSVIENKLLEEISEQYLSVSIA